MKKSGILITIVLLVLLIGMNAMFTVREDQYACTVRFSKIIDSTDQAGLHFKVPFIDNIKYFSKALSLDKHFSVYAVYTFYSSFNINVRYCLSNSFIDSFFYKFNESFTVFNLFNK